MGVQDSDNVWTAEMHSDIAGDGQLPQIVVKLHDDVKVKSASELGEYLDAQVRSGFGAAKSISQVTSLINASNREKMPSLMARAIKGDPTYRPHNFLNYFTLSVQPHSDLKGLERFLSSLSPVETAYINLRGENPWVPPADTRYLLSRGHHTDAPDGIGAGVNPANDSSFLYQGYHKPAPVGVGTKLVWKKPDGSGVTGADGKGVKLIDMELGWTLDHDDLKEHNIERIYGDIVNGHREHGTGVLGIVAARDNARGCVGIVPNIASIRVVSYAANNQRDYRNAMFKAIHDLDYGDILLLEAQIFDEVTLPIEALTCVYNLIRTATAAGIIVIEAAGNYAEIGVNLDEYQDSSGNFIFNPTRHGFREDSGAIMVGAAGSSSPHEKYPGSNFGGRVNCFAWGENVATCLSDVTGSKTEYRKDFSHTSAATAIIAGVAASVQGMAEQNLPDRLSPSQMRNILSDREIGTLSAGDLAAGGAKVDLIGVMPNLQAISERLLNI